MAQAECGWLPQNPGASTDALRTCHRFSPTRMATSKQRDNSECWQGCGKTANLGHCWWECETVQPSVWKFLKVDPEIPLLGAETHTRMFTEALFLTEETGNNLRVHQLMSG